MLGLFLGRLFLNYINKVCILSRPVAFPDIT